MKISYDKMTVEEFAPTGRAQEAQGLSSYKTYVTDPTQTIGSQAALVSNAVFPITASAATEVSKGQRRVMIKLQTVVPKSQIAAVFTRNQGAFAAAAAVPTRDVPVSAHLVLSVDDALWQLEAAAPDVFADKSMGEDQRVWDGGIHGLLNKCLAGVLAIAGAQDGNASMILNEKIEQPLTRALQGAQPLDVVSGEYGQL